MLGHLFQKSQGQSLRTARVSGVEGRREGRHRRRGEQICHPRLWPSVCPEDPNNLSLEL